MMSKKFAALVVPAMLAAFQAPAVRAADQGLIIQKALSLDMAIAAAEGALAQCRTMKYKCAVVVLNGSGRTLVSLEDDGAFMHRMDIAHKKAYTALVYRKPSKESVEGWSTKMAAGKPLAEGTLPSPPVEGTIAMGGGLPIIVGGETIGAIAVSGGPGWEADEAMGKAGLAKIADKLK